MVTLSKKILIVLVLSTLVMIPSLSTLGFQNQKIGEQKREIGSLNTSVPSPRTDGLTISITQAPLFAGIQIVITNTGTLPLTNISWMYSATGGIIRGNRENFGIIKILEPGKKEIISLSLFGIGKISLVATAQYDTMPPIHASATAYLFFFFAIVISDNENLVRYQVTFDSIWSSQTHPDDFPENPHFSGLIGAAHNDQVSFWEVGVLASPGIKNMAETGSKDPLNREIDDAINNGTVFRKLSGNGIRVSPGAVSLTFQTNQDYPLVTLVSMIAPSPDWFVGTDSINLFENGTWSQEKIIELYPYDSGTDSGRTYTSTDEPTIPPVPVFLIQAEPFLYNGKIVPLGTFTFTKI